MNHFCCVDRQSQLRSQFPYTLDMVRVVMSDEDCTKQLHVHSKSGQISPEGPIPEPRVDDNAIVVSPQAIAVTAASTAQTQLLEHIDSIFCGQRYAKFCTHDYFLPFF